jgi:hypothetical protein
MTLVLFLGAWGKMIHKKNLKQKISLHCPFKALWADPIWRLGYLPNACESLRVRASLGTVTIVVFTLQS